MDLKLNPLWGHHDDITINNNVVQRSKSVRNLGFYLDEVLDMQSHISKLCQLIHYSLRNIGRVRNLIDDETCKMLVEPPEWIIATPDSMDCQKNSIARLQLLQNKTSCIVTKSKKSITLLQSYSRCTGFP